MRAINKKKTRYQHKLSTVTSVRFIKIAKERISKRHVSEAISVSRSSHTGCSHAMLHSGATYRVLAGSSFYLS